VSDAINVVACARGKLDESRSSSKHGGSRSARFRAALRDAAVAGTERSSPRSPAWGIDSRHKVHGVTLDRVYVA